MRVSHPVLSRLVDTERAKAKASSAGSLQDTGGTDSITVSPSVSQAKGGCPRGQVQGPCPLGLRPGRDPNSELPESQGVPLSPPALLPGIPGSLPAHQSGSLQARQGVESGVPAPLDAGRLTWAKCSCPGKCNGQGPGGRDAQTAQQAPLPTQTRGLIPAHSLAAHHSSASQPRRDLAAFLLGSSEPCTQDPDSGGWGW